MKRWGSGSGAPRDNRTLNFSHAGGTADRWSAQYLHGAGDALRAELVGG